MGGMFVSVIAALPGLIAFLVFRTLVASTLVTLLPGYFVIGELTRSWLTYALVGALAAYVAYWLFLRGYPREAISENDRRRAPLGALWAIVIFAIMVAALWVAYQSGIVVS